MLSVSSVNSDTTTLACKYINACVYFAECGNYWVAVILGNNLKTVKILPLNNKTYHKDFQNNTLISSCLAKINSLNQLIKKYIYIYLIWYNRMDQINSCFTVMCIFLQYLFCWPFQLRYKHTDEKLSGKNVKGWQQCLSLFLQGLGFIYRNVFLLKWWKPLNYICSFLCYHNSRGIQVPTDYTGHYWGIYYSQIFNTNYFCLGINYSGAIWRLAHFTSARRMISTIRLLSYKGIYFFVRLNVVSWLNFRSTKFFKSFLSKDLSGQLDTLAEFPNISFCMERK